MSIVHAWQGAVTDDSFRVVAKIGGSAARLAFDTDSGLGSPEYTSLQSPSNAIVQFAVTELSPATRYYWAIEEDGVLDSNHRGTLKTFPSIGYPATFKIAAASCSGRDAVYEDIPETSNSPIFDTIRQANPDLFIHMGDLHYHDINTASLSAFRSGYDDVLGNARQEQLYRSVPLAYMWDDHDFGPNDSDRTSPGRDQACTVYRERVPHYPLANTGTNPVYQSFQIGRVLVIMTDLRADRDPDAATNNAAKTMLGATQKAWFFNLLATTDAEALIWVSTSPWITGSGNFDSWGLYAYERDEIVTVLTENGWLDRMCIVSGDIHALAIDNGENNDWGGFPVYHFAALDTPSNSRGGPYTFGPSEGYNRWGTLAVHDDGETITITGTGYINSTAWNSYAFEIESLYIGIGGPLTSASGGALAAVSGSLRSA